MLNAEQLLAALWRWRATFLLTFVLVLGGVAAATFSLPKVYSSTAYLWVTAGSPGGNDYEATQSNQVLNKTYAELLQTPGVADRVTAELPPGVGGSKAVYGVRITPITQSQLIKITAEGSTPRRAQVVADTYADVFLDRVAELNTENGGFSQVTLAEPASIEPDPVRPRPRLYLLVGAVLAAFAGTSAALIRHRFDRSVDIDGSTTHVLDLPILGRIPQSALPLPAFGGSDEEASVGHLADAFRLLLTNLTFANGAKMPRSLAVVSSGPGEGKSTCTAEIGRAAAELDVRTVLVDADLRKPRLSAMLAADGGRPGFSSLLAPKAPLAMNEVAVRAPGSALHVIASGPLPPNPVALLGQRGLAEFEQRAVNLFDLVIYDTPPLSLGSDASLVSAVADATILVIDARTRRAAVVQSVEQLRRSQAKVLGVVVNRVADERREGYYYQNDSRRGSSSGAAPAGARRLTSVESRPSGFGKRRA